MRAHCHRFLFAILLLAAASMISAATVPILPSGLSAEAYPGFTEQIGSGPETRLRQAVFFDHREKPPGRYTETSSEIGNPVAGLGSAMRPGQHLHASFPDIAVGLSYDRNRESAGMAFARSAAVPIPGSVCLMVTLVLVAGVVARKRLSGQRHEALSI